MKYVAFERFGVGKTLKDNVVEIDLFFQEILDNQSVIFL
jgi:hypothetical protein